MAVLWTTAALTMAVFFSLCCQMCEGQILAPILRPLVGMSLVEDQRGYFVRGSDGGPLRILHDSDGAGTAVEWAPCGSTCAGVELTLTVSHGLLVFDTPSPKCPYATNSSFCPSGVCGWCNHCQGGIPPYIVRGIGFPANFSKSSSLEVKCSFQSADCARTLNCALARLIYEPKPNDNDLRSNVSMTAKVSTPGAAGRQSRTAIFPISVAPVADAPVVVLPNPVPLHPIYGQTWFAVEGSPEALNLVGCSVSDNDRGDSDMAASGIATMVVTALYGYVSVGGAAFARSVTVNGTVEQLNARVQSLKYRVPPNGWNSQRKISGSSQEEGVTIRVTDFVGNSTVKSFPIFVVPVNSNISLSLTGVVSTAEDVEINPLAGLTLSDADALEFYDYSSSCSGVSPCGARVRAVTINISSTGGRLILGDCPGCSIVSCGLNVPCEFLSFSAQPPAAQSALRNIKWISLQDDSVARIPGARAVTLSISDNCNGCAHTIPGGDALGPVSVVTSTVLINVAPVNDLPYLMCDDGVGLTDEDSSVTLGSIPCSGGPVTLIDRDLGDLQFSNHTFSLVVQGINGKMALSSGATAARYIAGGARSIVDVASRLGYPNGIAPVQNGSISVTGNLSTVNAVLREAVFSPLPDFNSRIFNTSTNAVIFNLSSAGPLSEPQELCQIPVDGASSIKALQAPNHSSLLIITSGQRTTDLWAVVASGTGATPLHQRRIAQGPFTSWATIEIVNGGRAAVLAIPSVRNGASRSPVFSIQGRENAASFAMSTVGTLPMSGVTMVCAASANFSLLAVGTSRHGDLRGRVSILSLSMQTNASITVLAEMEENLPYDLEDCSWVRPSGYAHWLLVVAGSGGGGGGVVLQFDVSLGALSIVQSLTDIALANGAVTSFFSGGGVPMFTLSARSGDAHGRHLWAESSTWQWVEAAGRFSLFGKITTHNAGCVASWGGVNLQKVDYYSTSGSANIFICNSLLGGGFGGGSGSRRSRSSVMSVDQLQGTTQSFNNQSSVGWWNYERAHVVSVASCKWGTDGVLVVAAAADPQVAHVSVHVKDHNAVVPAFLRLAKLPIEVRSINDAPTIIAAANVSIGGGILLFSAMFTQLSDCMNGTCRCPEGVATGTLSQKLVSSVRCASLVIADVDANEASSSPLLDRSFDSSAGEATVVATLVEGFGGVAWVSVGSTAPIWSTVSSVRFASVRASVDDLNQGILVYYPVTTRSGYSSRLSIVINDRGATGSGGQLAASATIVLSVRGDINATGPLVEAGSLSMAITVLALIGATIAVAGVAVGIRSYRLRLQTKATQKELAEKMSRA